MKVLIFAQGSRGDIQPFIALAHALVEAGHQCVLAGPDTLAPLAAEYGVDYVGMHDLTIDAFNDPNANKALEADRGGTVRYLIQQGRANRRQMDRLLGEMAALDCKDADIVLHNHLCPGHEIAETLGVPSVTVGISPIFGPTSTFANPWLRFSKFRIPKKLNRASYLATHMMVRYNNGNTTKWRTQVLGLPHRCGHRNMQRLPNGRRATLLQPISRHFLPSPTSYPAWVNTTGFWFLPPSQSWNPPQHLKLFIESGPTPVYIGFGSLARVDNYTSSIWKIVTEAVRLAGVRAIVFLGSWHNFPQSCPKDMLILGKAVPFDWLFPRMAVNVHHGGTGTTAAALVAGKPQVLCPAVCEQAFNAERAHELGISPAPQPVYNMSADPLASAIKNAINDRTMSENARGISRAIRMENGVAEAITVLESLTARAQ